MGLGGADQHRLRGRRGVRCEHPHRENRRAAYDSGFSPLPRSEVMKCALLSNSSFESLSRRVDTRHEMFIGEGYGSWIQELANPTSAMWRFGPAAVVLRSISEGERSVMALVRT